MFELIFTSLPKGLFPGKSGFSTVAMTQGMPPNLISPLENLSGYNFTYSNNQLLKEQNPVCCYYIKMRYGNQQLYIAGRVAPNGLDYSRRNNKIAHHILLESPEELTCPDGAAGLFTTGSIDQNSPRVNNGNFVTDFQRDPCELGYRTLPAGNEPATRQANTWAAQTGEAAAAAWVAERFNNTPDMPVYVKYDAASTDGQTLLDLTREVCILLNKPDRHNFTFNTYFNTASPGTECFLRFVPSFSPLLGTLERFQKDSLITLGKPFPAEWLASGVSGDLIEIARTGCLPALKLSPENFVSAPAAPEMPTAPEMPEMPDAPSSMLSFQKTDKISRPPLLRFQHSATNQQQPNDGGKKYNLIMFFLCTLILGVLIGVLIFLPSSTDSSSGGDSGSSSSQQSEKSSDEDKQDEQDKEKTTGNADKKTGKSGSVGKKTSPQQKNKLEIYYLEFDKNGKFIYKRDNVIIKIQGKELKIKKLPPLPLKHYKNYMSKLRKYNRFQDSDQSRKDFDISRRKEYRAKYQKTEKLLHEKYSELYKELTQTDPDREKIQQLLEEFNRLHEQYQQELYDFYFIHYKSSNKITKHQVNEFNERRHDSYKKFAASKADRKAQSKIQLTDDAKKIFEDNQKNLLQADKELGEYLIYKSKPQSFYAKEKEAFEAELKKLLDKLPPEAQEVVKRYFNAEKPQMPNDERLKELAKELEKLFEIVEQSKASPQDAKKNKAPEQKNPEQKNPEQKNPEQNVPGVRTPGNESPKNGINNGLHGISASSGNAQTPGNKNSKQQ